MAKKRAAKGKADKVGSELPSGKVALQVRLDRELADRLGGLAQTADISINQLLSGLVRFAVENGRPGEPNMETRDGKKMFFSARRQPGCVYFGRPWSEISPDEAEELAELHGLDVREVSCFSEGVYYFTLDFTERRVVRDDDRPSRPGK